MPFVFVQGSIYVARVVAKNHIELIQAIAHLEGVLWLSLAAGWFVSAWAKCQGMMSRISVLVQFECGLELVLSSFIATIRRKESTLMLS